MNVIDYDTEATFRLSDELKMLIRFAETKYFRFSLASRTDVLDYKEEVAENIDSQDYVVRLDKTSHVVLSSQVYSKVVDRAIGVIHGLTGTTITLK
jgi:hypothetical protein